MPGSVFVSPTETVTGNVSYNATRVFVQPPNSRVVTYMAADVLGFSLENGGGEFISVPVGNKGKSLFHEALSPVTNKMRLVVLATNIDRRNGNNLSGVKDKPNYLFYSEPEKKIVASNIKEAAEYVKEKCKGIYTAVTVYKDKMYVIGLMDSEEIKKAKHLKLVDDYANDRCEYRPRDY